MTTSEHPFSWVTPVLLAVALERKRQDAKWGPQNHPTGFYLSPENTYKEQARKQEFAHLQAMGKMTWKAILAEEVAKAFNTPSDQEAYEELVQVAAVAVAAAESIRRRLDKR
jgi:hypothetical protein